MPFLFVQVVIILIALGFSDNFLSKLFPKRLRKKKNLTKKKEKWIKAAKVIYIL